MLAGWHEVVGTDPLRIWVTLVWGWLYATLNCLAMVWGEPALGQSSLSTFPGPLGTGWEVEAFQGHHEAQLKSYSCPWDNVKIWAWLGQARPRRLDKQTEAGEKPTSGNRQMASQTGRWSQGCPTKFSLPGMDLALGVWQRGVGRGQAKRWQGKWAELLEALPQLWQAQDGMWPQGAILRAGAPSEACGSRTLPGTGMELLPGWTGYKMKSI